MSAFRMKNGNAILSLRMHKADVKLLDKHDVELVGLKRYYFLLADEQAMFHGVTVANWIQDAIERAAWNGCYCQPPHHD